MPRDFDDIQRRVTAAAGDRVRVEPAGPVDGCPLLVARVTAGGVAARHRVLLTGGVHGDEPAGTEAATAFLEQVARRAPQGVEFLVLPCINPHGYVHDCRENAAGLDINRSMNEPGVAVVDLLKQILGDSHFDLALDLHEDYDGEGFYMYETPGRDLACGQRIIAAVKAIGPVDGEVNEDDIPLAEGVMAIDPAWGTGGWSSYVAIKHAAHTIIAETASGRPMDERLAIHACVVDESLRQLTAA